MGDLDQLLQRKTIVAAIGLAVLLLGWVLVGWFRERREDGRLRDQALPACAERLGSAETCRAHVAQYHDDCARLTRRRPGRLSNEKGGPDLDAYVSCVVLGVDGWVADNGRKADEEARRRTQERALP